MESNYEKTRKRTQGEFLKYDQAEMIRRFDLDADDHYLCFSFLGSGCRVDRRTGAVECFEDGTFREADFDEAMTVYDLLCWARPEAAPSGELVNMKSLSTMYSASGPLGTNGFWMKEAKKLDHCGDLPEVLENLGGEPAAGGDASAVFEVFRGMKVQFTFWNSDEEFDPSIQLYWDKNTLLYMHYETVWYAGGVLITRILREMDRR